MPLRAAAASEGSVVEALLARQPDELARHSLLEELRGMGVLWLEEPGPVHLGLEPLGIELARALRAVPLRPTADSGWWLIMADPWDERAIQRAGAALGQLPVVAGAPSAWINQQLRLLPTTRRVADDGKGDVVAFVDRAISEAIGLEASDIHFETSRNGLQVKHRVDGVLRLFAQWNERQRAEEVVSRIKVLAQLDITERRVPQDGRFRHISSNSAMDLRVSIMPSVHGEDAVLRLLDRAQLRQQQASLSLDALGFDADSVWRIRELGALPHGMLLVTGPTGSGKTTTVYGLLTELNRGDEKIITIEDPVEYELPGVLQIPVNERKGLSFAKGLRSILRHDPDRILVGEIRDGDTAEIAVQSALTGHQVFTTVHANSLYDVTGRFRHFGLDMFGFVAALNGIVVQRLVRALCPHCVKHRPATSRETAWLVAQGVDLPALPTSGGCSACAGTGYRGRFVLAEVHAVDDDLRDLITGNQPISRLREHVASSGVVALPRVAAEAVAAKRTSLEEVRRVVGLV